MSKINIGVGLDLEKLIDGRLLIQGNSGSGKSYLIRNILEEANEKVLFTVLDIEGEYHTLREKYDILIIGGKAGDIPLTVKSAKLLPRELLQNNISSIIDMSDLKMNERILFVKHFLEALMELPREYWKAFMVIIEEAHKLCGQQEKQDSTWAVIDLMTRGRKRGFMGGLITQRISKLHKDASAEANTKFIGRTFQDLDRKRSAEELGFTEKKQVLSLRDLKAGEFYSFGSALNPEYVRKISIKQSITTHPKVGMKFDTKISAPTAKIKSMLTKISNLPKELDEEIKTKSDMKKKINDLSRELRISKQAQPKPQADEKALERARKQGAIQIQKNYEGQLKALENNSRQLNRKLIEIGKIIGQEVKYNFPPKVVITSPQSIVNTTKPVTQVTPKRNLTVTPVQDGEFNLSLCERKLYSLLCQYSERGFTKPQIGVFTGYRHGSGGFNNALSRLNQLGLITRNGGSIQASEVRDELTGEFDFSKEAIISKLSKCENEIYNVLIENQEDSYSKEELAETTPSNYSPNSGGFNNAISRLNTLGLLERNGGLIKLNPEVLVLE